MGENYIIKDLNFLIRIHIFIIFIYIEKLKKFKTFELFKICLFFFK